MRVRAFLGDGEEREGAQILFSPKGDLMYFFTQDDVLIYDTNTLKEVDRWEISKTLFEEGLAPLADALGACVVDGGTDAGVMALIGRPPVRAGAMAA